MTKKSIAVHLKLNWRMGIAELKTGSMRPDLIMHRFRNARIIEGKNFLKMIEKQFRTGKFHSFPYARRPDSHAK